jgi:multidrug efflux pump subunit AcrA (membrane-fusion protein)
LQAAETVTLPNCLLSLDAEVQVPAQEAGVLLHIPVHEGQQVTKGDLLAQIDDILPKMKYNVAYYKLKVAEKEAANDIEVRYSVAAYKYAGAKLQRSFSANEKTPNTRTAEEIDEQKLDKEKSKLMIEKSQKDLDVAGLQQGVSKAELEAAKADLEHRKLLAPLNAMVVELARHEGEWVAAGDTVMRLVKIDPLRVQGYLNAEKYRPSDIQGQPVQVVVTLPSGQKESFPGTVTYVNPVIRGGNFQIRAEVRNRMEGGFPLLNPGMKAEMTIQLK